MDTHPLELWREDEDITKAEAALAIGMGSSQYHDILAGRTEPSAARMREILAVTERRVTPTMIVEWGDRQ